MSSKTPLDQALSDYMKGKRRSVPSFQVGQQNSGKSRPDQLTRSYADIGQQHPKVIKELKERETISTTALIGALLTLPELQSNSIRIETLQHLALMFCNGPRKPKLSQVGPWFDQLDKGPCGLLEDPAEDLFVSTVSDDEGSYRLFEGGAVANAFYVQIFIQVIATLPDNSSYDFLRNGVKAVLRLSEALADRAETSRYMTGNPVPRKTLPEMSREMTDQLRARMRFSAEDLQDLGINRVDLMPFIFNMQDIAKLSEASIGHSALENAPLLAHGDDVYVILPTTLGLALRNFVIETCISGDTRQSFERALAQAYADTFKSESILGERHGAPLSFRAIGQSRLSIAVVSKRLDEGRFLDLILFCDSLTDFEETSFVGRNPTTDLNRLVEKTAKQLKAKHLNTPGFNESLLLVVGCGWGRALGLVPPPQEDQFLTQFLPAHDLITLSRTTNFQALDLFKILGAQNAATELGAEIFNASGLLNLVAWVDRNNGHIIPHDDIEPEAFDPQTPLQLMIPQNENLRLRANSAIGVDLHTVRDPLDRNVLVRRKNSQPAYGRIQLTPFYLDLEAAGDQRMRAVYQGQSGNWWVEVELQRKLPHEIAFNLAQMVMHWAEIVARRLDSEAIGSPEGIGWMAHFADEAVPTIDDHAPSDVSSICEATIEGKTANIRIGPGFLVASNHPQNIAERVIVQSLFVTGLQLLGRSVSIEKIDDFVQSAVRTDKSRHFHAFSVPSVRDHTRASLPARHQHISKFDDAWSRLGLGWLARERELGHTIEGPDNCCAFLRSLIDRVIERMSASLGTYNRTALVTDMLSNHEALAAETDTWKRTFGAIASLADSQAKAEADATEKLGAFTAGCITSRIVLEMALCICSETASKKSGRIDKSRLLADASMLFHLGGFHDAIRDGIMEPVVRISPGGDVQMNHDFTEKTARAYGKSYQKRELNYATQKYNDHFLLADELEEVEEKKPLPTEVQAFSQIWREEFGVTLEETRAFMSGFVTIAAEDQKAVTTLKRSDLIMRLVTAANLPASIVETCLAQFTLSPRARWNSAPDGYLDSSWQPWRFRRQLSIVSRPVIELDNTANPLIALAPSMTAHHIAVYVSNVLHARFDQSIYHSNAMKKYVGETTGRDGEAFNEYTAKRFRELGWQAKANLSDGEILNRPKVASFGDVDVLAWNSKEKRILVIECKDLSLDKTIGEISRRLARYRGLAPNGRRDDLRKHLDRVEELSNNSVSLGEYVGITDPVVEGLFVTGNEVPMKFDEGLRSKGIRFVPISDIASL